MREAHLVTRPCGELTAVGSALRAEVDALYLRRARTAIARMILVAIAVLGSPSWAAAQPGAGAGPTSVAAPAAELAKPRRLVIANKPWLGDFDRMLERRVIRVDAPFSRSLYFSDKGRERGLALELVRDFERYINVKYAQQLGKRPLTVYVVPATRDKPCLTSGRASPREYSGNTWGTRQREPERLLPHHAIPALGRGDQVARTTSPPTITRSARMSGSASSGTVSASWSRTAMSASLPISRVPLSSSSKVR